MFETAVVRSRAADRRFGFLTLSLAAHTAVIAAVIAASVASTRLPQESPRQMMRVYFAPPVTLPPALGTPAPPRAAAPHAAMAHAPAVQTAPAAIPDAIPTVAATTGTPSIAPATGSGETEGVPWGTPGGVGSQAPPAPDAAGPLVAGLAGVKAPVVIHRVEPLYPQIALRNRMSGSVVLQCIIDKTGHIRDVRVVNSSFAAFEQPAIDAVQQWLFAPGTLNGQTVDTIFELTVKFQVK